MTFPCGGFFLYRPLPAMKTTAEGGVRGQRLKQVLAGASWLLLRSFSKSLNKGSVEGCGGPETVWTGGPRWCCGGFGGHYVLSPRLRCGCEAGVCFHHQPSAEPESSPGQKHASGKSGETAKLRRNYREPRPSGQRERRRPERSSRPRSTARRLQEQMQRGVRASTFQGLLDL